jgi:hypothetical protein
MLLFIIIFEYITNIINYNLAYNSIQLKQNGIQYYNITKNHCKTRHTNF